MIIFNYLAAGMFIAALAIGYGLQSALGVQGNDNFLAVMIAMSIACLADLAFRFTRKEENLGRFLWPSTGGHIMFVPVWVCSTFLMFDTIFEIL